MNKEMIDLSICVTVKNRSLVKYSSKSGKSKMDILHLFPKMVESLADAVKIPQLHPPILQPGDRQSDVPAEYKVELSITDWRSDDWPLEEWIYEKAGDLPVVLNHINDEYFSRGKGLNIAAKNSRGTKLFFCDADILTPREFIKFALSDNRCLFPICMDEKTGWAGVMGGSIYGYGICVLTKDIFDKIGPWPEWTSWGGEDNVMWNRANKGLRSAREIWRNKFEGLIHQWHPKRREHYERPDRWHWDKSGGK